MYGKKYCELDRWEKSEWMNFYWSSLVEVAVEKEK